MPEPLFAKTKASVAIWVELSPAVCVVAVVPLTNADDAETTPPLVVCRTPVVLPPFKFASPINASEAGALIRAVTEEVDNAVPTT